MDRHHRRMGFRRDGRCVHRGSLWQQSRASQPGNHSRRRGRLLGLLKIAPLHLRATTRRLRRSHTGLAALRPALERNARRFAKACRVLHRPGNPQRRVESAQRNHRHDDARLRRSRNFLESCFAGWTRRRPRPLPCRRAGVGNWPFTRRHHRLRHQSRPRFRSAPRPRHSCPSLERARRTGATPPFPSSVRW